MNTNKTIIEKQVHKLLSESVFLQSLNELKKKLSIYDINIEIEEDNISWEFVSPIKLNPNFKKMYEISEVGDISLSKEDIFIEDIEFEDLDINEKKLADNYQSDLSEIDEDLSSYQNKIELQIEEEIQYSKEQKEKRINEIIHYINLDLEAINNDFTKLQSKISQFIENIDESTKSGFINSFKRFMNKTNKNRVIDNYMQVIEFKKYELKKKIWEHRQKLYLQIEGDIFDFIKTKIKALYHIKNLKFELTHLKVNEESIRFQIEEIVDEAYQTLYIEKMDKDLEVEEQVISVSDGEIYKMTYKNIIKLFSSYKLKIN
jgi:hypothetical protein